MDILLPHQERDRLEFKKFATNIGFDDRTMQWLPNVDLLLPRCRCHVLTVAWKAIGVYLTSNEYNPFIAKTVSWVARYTLDLWFSNDWGACSAEMKTPLIEHMMKVYPSAYITMHPYYWPYMFAIHRSPWAVGYFGILLERINGPDVLVELEPKDSEFIQQEGVLLIILRMVHMFDFGLVKMVKEICTRMLLMWQDPASLAYAAMHDTPNSAEYMEYVGHIQLIAICQMSKADMQYTIGRIQRCLAYDSNIGTKPLDQVAEIVAQGLKESNKTLTEFFNEFLYMVPNQQLPNKFGAAVEHYVTLIAETQIRKLHSMSSTMFSLSDYQRYEVLVQMFMQHRESSEELMETTALVSERLFAKAQNLRALQYSYKQVMQRTHAEWYSTKLTILLGILREEVNELEDLKYNDIQEADEIILKEQEVGTYFRDLAILLATIPYLEQEAWLTAFSLHPCKEYMDAVAKCGTRNLRAIQKQALKLKETQQKPVTSNLAEEQKIIDVAVQDGQLKSFAVAVQDEQSKSVGVAVQDERLKIVAVAIQDEQLKSISIQDEQLKSSDFIENRNHNNVSEPIKPPVVVSYEDEQPCTSAAFLASNGFSLRFPELQSPAVEVKDDKPPIQAPIKKARRKPQMNKNTNRTAKRKRFKPFVAKSRKTDKTKSRAIAKPDANDKDSADLIYAAAAGAATNLSLQTTSSIQYPAFALLHSVTDAEDLVKYTNYDDTTAQFKELDNILNNLPILESNRNDLLTLLIAPRYKRLSWVLCWRELRKRCCKLLANPDLKKKFALQSMADANSRLTHLHIDYDKLKDKPQMDYGTIEAGYERFYAQLEVPVVAKSKKRKSGRKPARKRTKANRSRKAKPKPVKETTPAIVKGDQNQPVIDLTGPQDSQEDYLLLESLCRVSSRQDSTEEATLLTTDSIVLSVNQSPNIFNELIEISDLDTPHYEDDQYELTCNITQAEYLALESPTHGMATLAPDLFAYIGSQSSNIFDEFIESSDLDTPDDDQHEVTCNSPQDDYLPL